MLEGLDLRGIERLLLDTRNSVLLKQRQIKVEYAFVSEDAARYLVDIGIKLVGVGYLSTEQYRREGHPTHPTHHILLCAGVVIVEGLNLTEVPAGDY